MADARLDDGDPGALEPRLDLLAQVLRRFWATWSVEPRRLSASSSCVS
jgi:hypothetical protein